MFTTIGEAVLLVAAIIFVFLRNWRAVLIPLVTIPVSLIGAFALMLLFGFSINTLTLLALVLAVGLVVDDAIVVLENIYRHIEEGMGRREAAFSEAKEIGFVALTLSPMMCSKVLRHQASHGRLYNTIEGLLAGMTAGYGRLLAWTLRLRWLVMNVFVAVAAASAVLRLRPILMTSGAMVLGAIPLALSSGAGAESRQQIGWVIVGGMLLGTLLTLFVVPIVYTLPASSSGT